MKLPVLKWIARVLSLVSVTLIALFLFDDPSGLLRLSSEEMILLFFFPVIVIAGFAVSWVQEGFGSIVTFIGLLSFYAANLIMHERFPGGIAFLLFCIPAVFFALFSILRTNENRNKLSGQM